VAVSAPSGAGAATQPIHTSSPAATPAEAPEGTGVGQQPISTIAAFGNQLSQSEGTPLNAPAPPTTTTVGGVSGCGGPGMGAGSTRGSAPASAVLSDPTSVDIATDAAARSAQAAGPVVTTTADPATRPD
jgi:hypothetical protein